MLGRRRELKALERISRELGERLWIVGGAARDVVMGREVAEVDVAVASHPEPVARAMEAEGFGRAVELSSASPPVWRVAGRREIDVARIEGATIEEDLRRRDFTANAMALDLAGHRWLDPFGGREAIAEGRLRMVSPRNLREDPLRVLRAARFLATHGLRPDGATSRACRAAAPLLEGVAGERIRTEWVKLLGAARAAPAIRWAAMANVLAPAFGLDAAAERRAGASSEKFDAVEIRELPAGPRVRVRLALFCARIGLGADRAASWLAARRFGRTEAGDAASLLRLVEDAGRARGDRGLWRWVRDAGDLAEGALALLAVLRPRQGARKRELARRARRPRRRGPRVTGEDVMAWSGIPPGPAVGKLLSELEVEVLRGAVRSRREARNWLSLQVQ
ncbi:MAG TPA: hypothetical protein VKG01_04130 [Thermoanaerobaculia bacterium]|nr:hypothetical protein [Thermoanaerobaculia bacterium]